MTRVRVKWLRSHYPDVFNDSTELLCHDDIRIYKRNTPLFLNFVPNAVVSAQCSDNAEMISKKLIRGITSGSGEIRPKWKDMGR
jgi:hypothetical protein